MKASSDDVRCLVVSVDTQHGLGMALCHYGRGSGGDLGGVRGLWSVVPCMIF